MITLPGHGCSLHDRASLLAPTHGAPPNAGGGLVHVRVRSCTPPPHVTGQMPQAFQAVHLPSTISVNMHTNGQKRLTYHWFLLDTSISA